MKGRLRALHARALVHATEDLDKVKLAVTNVVGPQELAVLDAKGVHGNPIMVVEATVTEPDEMSRLFSKLSSEDLDRLLSTLDQRVDEGCNFFVRVDKQNAYLGETGLGQSDDVVSIRIRVAAFPAKPEVAKKVVREIVEQELASRDESNPATA